MQIEETFELWYNCPLSPLAETFLKRGQLKQMSGVRLDCRCTVSGRRFKSDGGEVIQQNALHAADRWKNSIFYSFICHGVCFVCHFAK